MEKCKEATSIVNFAIIVKMLITKTLESLDEA